MTTVFTPIIEGTSDIQRIFWEDELHVAFLTHKPHTRGHTLVIPKKEYKTYLDMPEDEYLTYMATCRKISATLNSIFEPVRMGFVISGFEVPHVHVHLIPINFSQELNTDTGRLVEKVELDEVTDFIRSKINAALL